jgi:hypothetical protein
MALQGYLIAAWREGPEPAPVIGSVIEQFGGVPGPLYVGSAATPEEWLSQIERVCPERMKYASRDVKTLTKFFHLLAE